MSRYRDFDAARAEDQGEPLTFRLGGRDFETVPEIPAGPLIELAATAGDFDADAVAAFGRFLFGIVRVDQQEAFRDVLGSVGFSTLFAVVQWVIEEATGRPLSQPSSSDHSLPQDGEPSRVVSFNPVESRSA